MVSVGVALAALVFWAGEYVEGCCANCGAHEIRAKQLCSRCYRRAKYQSLSPDQKELLRKQRREYHQRHKSKRNLERTKWYQEHRDYAIDRSLKRRYGIGADDRERLFAEQGGRCAICGRLENEFSKSLGVDHDWATGTVRGLLCHYCNKGIGLFRESLGSLAKAIAYLAKHKGVK